jgi:hypothetical protein
MGLGDLFRGLFSGRGNPDLVQLEEFAQSHKGVEGYIEPRTATNPTTLLLVDRHGVHVRGAVREPRDALRFCERLGIPVYDAQVVGYPKRMKEFKQGRTPEGADLDRQIEDLERRLGEDV